MEKDKLERLRKSRLAAVNQSTVESFIPESYRKELPDDDDLWPTFKLAPLPVSVGFGLDDGKSEVDLASEMGGKSTGRLLLGKTKKLQIVACLVGWQNFLDPKTGAPIQFHPCGKRNPENIPESYVRDMLQNNISRIPFRVIDEICDFIDGRSSTKEDVEKKSVGSSDGTPT